MLWKPAESSVSQMHKGQEDSKARQDQVYIHAGRGTMQVQASAHQVSEQFQKAQSKVVEGEDTRSQASRTEEQESSVRFWMDPDDWIVFLVVDQSAEIVAGSAIRRDA